MLADEIRVDILCAIATLQYEHGDAGAGAIELSFSDIYDHVDVDNTSKLSYHLGELSGVYLRKTDEGYSLSHAGERIARFILSENYGQPRTFGPVPVDGTCIFCGEEPLEASLFHQFFGVECTACGEQVAGQPITPTQVRTRDEAEIVRSVKLQCVEVYRQIRRGLCPECGGQLSAAIADLIDGPLPEADPYLVTSECEECLRAYNRGLEELNSLSEETEIDADLDVTQYTVKEARAKLHDYEQSIDSERSRIEGEKESVQSQLNELDDIDEALSQLLSEKREQQKIVEEKENELQSLEDDRQKIQELQTKRRDEFIDYVDAYHDLKSLYSLVISEFSADQSAILDEVKFDANLEVTDGLQSQLYDLLDGRSVNIAEIQPVIQSVADAIQNSEQSERYAESYLNEALSFKDQLLEKASAADFERRVFTGNFKLSEQILLEETRMEDLSLGQKGTVLLKILLAQDGKPLIIDQPEENLDNRFVYRTLKDAFKEAKTKRQVIIATHNANLVVNTDAEQVVVAQYEENEISFKSGPLEDEEIREEVTTVLEGGEEAFVQREEKYGLA